ncbi:MAG: DinB family protein [Vicinamibacterales bacterium]
MNYYGSKDLAASWRTVRKNTIQVAEDIPEEQYSFRAAPGTMSVGELLAHLAASPHWANQCHFVDQKVAVTMDDFGKWMGEVSASSKALTGKAEIVAALKADGAAFAAGLEAMTDAQLGEQVALPNGSKTRFEMLLGIKEHEMHHRAQLFLMERMIGIVPHLTRARQAARG